MGAAKKIKMLLSALTCDKNIDFNPQAGAIKSIRDHIQKAQTHTDTLTLSSGIGGGNWSVLEDIYINN